MLIKLTYTRKSLRPAFLLAAAVLACGVGFASHASASIWVPEDSLFSGNIEDAFDATSDFDANKLIAELEQPASEGASGGTTEPASPASLPEPIPTDSQDNPAKRLASFASHGESSSSGTSSSSSGSSAGSAGASLLATAAMLLPDSAPARRFAYERTLSLPDAPGTELLRPPQV